MEVLLFVQKPGLTLDQDLSVVIIFILIMCDLVSVMSFSFFTAVLSGTGTLTEVKSVSTALTVTDV